ncbi:MAG: PIN domain-containing protein [Marmoricola sp.]
MIVVVADTSGLLAALDKTHPAGDAARAVLRDAGTLIVSPVLLSELDHVGRRVLGRDATHQAIDDIRRWARTGRVVLPEVTADILDTAQAVRERYLDLRLDLADAVNVAFAAQFHTDAVLTLDHRDFRAVQPLTDHRTFRLLPDDM